MDKMIRSLSLFIVLFLMCSKVVFGQQLQTGLNAINFENNFKLAEPVTNCAVESVNDGWDRTTYIFGGMDSTLKWSGIHLRCYKLEKNGRKITPLPNIPDTMGKIAHSATRIKDKIYVVGGYHVFANGHEVSSSRAHEFDIEGDTFTNKQINLPVPIDDHVQVRYRDSLLYVIGGWSNTGNVGNVQIYDPANNKWLVGTPLPDNRYKVFGASGFIEDSTMVIVGGALNGANFPASKNQIKGVIDPNNPLKITWSINKMCDSCAAYRSGCVPYPNLGAIWFGGSDTTYNYDGKAYVNGNQLRPVTRTLFYNSTYDSANYIPYSKSFWINHVEVNYNQVTIPMDIRDMGMSGEWVIFAGGILENGKVYDRLTEVHVLNINSVNHYSQDKLSLKLYPNPASNTFKLKNVEFNPTTIKVYNSRGQFVKTFTLQHECEVDCSLWPDGIYLLQSDRGEVLRFVKD